MWWEELNDAAYAPEIELRQPDKQPEYYYNSITSRFPIMNALTGEIYLDSNKRPYRMGSVDERRFYVIVMGDPNNSKEACKLFFDTPEQYERATGSAVSVYLKTKFKSRRYNYFKTRV